jgi:hypothetical protein
MRADSARNPRQLPGATGWRPTAKTAQTASHNLGREWWLELSKLLPRFRISAAGTRVPVLGSACANDNGTGARKPACASRNHPIAPARCMVPGKIGTERRPQGRPHVPRIRWRGTPPEKRLCRVSLRGTPVLARPGSGWQHRRGVRSCPRKIPVAPRRGALGASRPKPARHRNAPACALHLTAQGSGKQNQAAGDRPAHNRRRRRTAHKP